MTDAQQFGGDAIQHLRFPYVLWPDLRTKVTAAHTEAELAEQASPVFCETNVPGCFVVRYTAYSDSRGILTKTVSPSFAARGLNNNFVETFYTVSGEKVLRGMHLQLPPADHAKLVYCVTGSALDVALDLRRGSPAFGQFAVVELGADHRNALYLPSGVAHGFLVCQAPAVMVYHVTSEHVPSLDRGVRWDSFGMRWREQQPVVSARDSALPRLDDFLTPFQFDTADRKKLE